MKLNFSMVKKNKLFYNHNWFKYLVFYHNFF